MREALYMPALVAARFNPDMIRVYDRLVGAGKPPKVATTAVMRKLATAIYSVAKHKRPFSHPPTGPTGSQRSPPT